VEIAFPLEFIVDGVPISAQAKRPASVIAWKERVWLAASGELPEGHWAFRGPVAVTILYFPPAAMTGDVDNIVKPILDALRPGIYLDDQQVARVWVQKFEPDGAFAFSSPTSRLVEALERRRPVVYIRVDTVVIAEELRW